MANVAIPGGIFLPPPIFTLGVGPGFSTFVTISTTNTWAYGAWVLRAPKTGNLSHVGFRIGTLTTPQDLRVCFQDVNTGTGNPDGTIDQFCVIPLASLAANTWIVTPGPLTHDGTGGGTKRAVTAGDLFAVVVRFATTAGNLGLQQQNLDDQQFAFPFTVQQDNGPQPYGNTVSVTYDDGTYAAFDGLVYPWAAFTNTTLHTGTTPDEVGNLFVPPVSMQVDAAYAKVGGSASWKLVLYDRDGTSVLGQTSTATAALKWGGASAYHQGYPFTGGPVTLNGGDTYRIVVQPTTASNVTVWSYDVSPAAAMEAVPLGSSYYATERTNAGAWTDTNTRRYLCGLRLVGIDEGGAGPLVSGGLVS